MNTSNWIALAALLIPLMWGGAVVVAKLTRIAMAPEVLAKRVEETAGALTATNQQVQNHENRLNKANL
jgi:hypothetical protein